MNRAASLERHWLVPRRGRLDARIVSQIHYRGHLAPQHLFVGVPIATVLALGALA